MSEEAYEYYSDSSEDGDDPIERAISWANGHLSAYGETVNDFTHDFCDGLKLGHIVESVTHNQLLGEEKSAKTVFQKRHNISITLRYLINYRIISKNLVKRDDILWGELVPTYNLLRLINVRLDNGDLPPLPKKYQYNKKDKTKRKRRRKQQHKDHDENEDNQEPPKSKYAVGIDIGTCECRFSVYRGEATDHADSPEGDESNIPTIIAFQGHEKFIGHVPDDVIEDDNAIVVSDIKRIIGRDFANDPELKNETSYINYVEEDSQTHRPFITVENESDNEDDGRNQEEEEIHNKRHSFEELMALLLTNVKQKVCDHIGENIVDAVISVPTFYVNSQRQAIKDAARIAGFNVIRIVSDTAASIIASQLGNSNKNEDEDHKKESVEDENQQEKRKNMIVFDMGGGKVDATLFHVENENIYSSINNAGKYIGGRDFDARLASLYESILEKSNEDVDKEELEKIRNHPGQRRKLMKDIENAKISLSTQEEVNLRGKIITRGDFEDHCYDLFEKALEPLKTIFDENSDEKDKLKRVLLSGGSTKIPKLREALREYLGPDVELFDVESGCTISAGAAIQGAIIKGEVNTEQVQTIQIKNILQLSIGISQANGVNSIIIPKGTPLPAKYTTMATTSADGQTNVAFDVVQGERKMAKDCFKLGHITVNGIQVAKRCVPKIEVVMEIDDSGFLSVHASDLTTGASISTNLSSNSNLSEDDILHILSEAEKHKEKDDLRLQVATDKGELNYEINKFEKILRENKQLKIEDVEQSRRMIDSARKWLRENESTDNLLEIKNKRDELDQQLKKICPE